MCEDSNFAFLCLDLKGEKEETCRIISRSRPRYFNLKITPFMNNMYLCIVIGGKHLKL